MKTLSPGVLTQCIIALAKPKDLLMTTSKAKQLLLFFLTALCCIFYCPQLSAKSITIGSRDFPESVLIAEILSTAIEENTDIKVERKFNLGGVKINLAAMQSEKLDIYPDYSGSLIHNLLGEYDTKAYLDNYLKETLDHKYDFALSKALGFDNSFVLAVRKDFANEHKLKSISDLKSYMDKHPQEKLKVAFKHSFIKRPDGYKQIQEIYGINFKNLRAMEYNIALQNLINGKLDIIDSFSTDSRMKHPSIVSLEDDRHALLAYSAVFVSQNKTLENHPELKKILNKLSNRLSNKKMLELNARVEQGETYHNVALSFLEELQKTNTENSTNHKRRSTSSQNNSQNKISDSQIQARLKQDLPLLQKAFAEHLKLSLTATFFASLIGIIIGILISYQPRLAKIVLGLISITQTIPSLALLALLIPLVGLGFYPAITALFIYALLPVIQNTYTGISSIENKYIELANSLALSEFKTLARIKLPLALNFIIAGVRTSLVICIGTATLATFVGGGGLGDLIKAGIDLNSNYLISLGAVPAALLALASSLVLSKIEKSYSFQ